MSTEDDRKATETVLRILRHESVWKLGFMTNAIPLPRRHISPVMYQLVSEAIVDKKVTVMVWPEVLGAGVNAKYFLRMPIKNGTEFYDVIVLRSPDLGGTVDEQFVSAANIIHECTHAGFDLLELPRMTHAEHEAAAYIAGAIFAAEAVLLRKGDPKKVTWTTLIGKAAWDIALLEIENKNVPKALYEALDLAIRADPSYKDTADSIVNNDGVGREWKLKKAAR